MDQQLGQHPDENQESANEPAEEQESESKQPRDEYTPGSPIRKSHTGLAVFLTIIITAIIAGGGVYLWLTYFQPEEATNANQAISNQNVNTVTTANKNQNVNTTTNLNQTNANANTSTNLNVTNTNQTSKWQTYTNSTCGYSMQYTDKYELDASQESINNNSNIGYIVFHRKSDLPLPKDTEGPPSIMVQCYKNENNLTIEEWVKLPDDGIKTANYSGTHTNTTLDNQSAIQYSGEGLGHFQYIDAVTPDGNYIINVSVSYYEESDSITNDYKSFLTTFKFTQSTISDWQTYSNAKMKYTFDYPKSWTIKENDSEQDGYNVVDVDFYNQQNQKMAQSVCPLPETGFEMFDFVDQTRNLVKNSITYEIYLGLGTPLPESGRQNGLNMIWIRPLDAQGQTQAGKGTDSCGIFSGSDLEPDDKIFIAIYDSIE